MTNDFLSLGLPQSICGTLSKIGLQTPTPIQQQAIPHLIAGRDLMGLAQTGTGKTAAFALPVIHHLMGIGEAPMPKAVRALVLAPTRELANQIGVNVRAFVRDTHLRVQVVVGGASIHVQTKNLHRGTDILVATPGRLLDLVERKALRLDMVQFLILDEADQMLDLGFIHSLRKIAKLVAPKRQTLLFSATMPAQMEELSRTFLKDPIRVQVAPPGKTADKITQSVHFIDQAAKPALLKDLLAERPGDLSLVFARTKHGAERLMKSLVAVGLSAQSIHGNKSQNQRERAIKDFREGKVRILVATDVAARGIDIPGVSHVYNFDLPEVAENYVHRIGRTARAGAAGEAVAFCGPHETHLFKAVEQLIGITIPVASGTMASRMDAMAAKKAAGAKQGQNNGQNAGRGRAQPGAKPSGTRSAKKPHRKGGSVDAVAPAPGLSLGPKRANEGGAAKRSKPRKAFRGRKAGRNAA